MHPKRISLVWLKRDLRLHDHAALQAACSSEWPVLMLYAFEPSLMRQPDFDVRHARFVWQSLECLKRNLNGQYGMLVMKGEVTDVLSQLNEVFRLMAIYSHQETGNGHTYERDKQVKQWCRWRNIPWLEYSDRGIRRGIKHRENWPEQWYAYMQDRQVQTLVPSACWGESLPVLPCLSSFAELGYGAVAVFQTGMQPGGAAAGMRYLQSFMEERSQNYQRHISKPLLSRTSCSRLSPYLACGCLSMRQVYQAGKERMEASMRSLPAW